MAITVSPTVTLIGNDVSVDLTSRTLGVQITTSAELGTMGQTSGTIDLDNTDGELTPGIGGEFSATDWFGLALRFEALIEDDGAFVIQPSLGDAIITGFELVDDGLTSFVRISFNDAFTVAGSSLSTIEFNTGSPREVSPETIVGAIFDGSGSPGDYSYYSGVSLPTLGYPTATATVVGVSERIGTDWPSRDGRFDFEANFSAVAPAKDFLNTSVLPAGPFTVWPTIAYDGFPEQGIRYQMVIVGPWAIQIDNTRNDFVFDETPGSGELPFRSVSRRFAADELLNETTVTSIATPSGELSYTASNSASAERYGSRARYLQQILVADPASITGAYSSDIFKELITPQAIAERYSNILSDLTFHMDVVEVSASMIAGLDTVSATLFARLLDVERSLYQYAKVSYTPTGGSSQVVSDGVVYSRTISMTPTDTTVRLELYPRGVLAGLKLDDADLGTLGGTLDTYDSSTFTYDSKVLPYEGRPQIGNRLG